MAVSELPPHPERTNKNVTATAFFLTTSVCHPSPEGGRGVSDALRQVTCSKTPRTPFDEGDQQWGQVPLKNPAPTTGRLGHHDEECPGECIHHPVLAPPKVHCL